mgnify:FL=1
MVNFTFDKNTMIETGIQIFLFFIIAFLSGLFYPVFYAIIGAPSYVPHPQVGDKFPNVVQFGITKPSMIFRRYGKWLSRKQNEWEQRHDKSLIQLIEVPLFSFKGLLKTSYGRGFEMSYANEGDGIQISLKRIEGVETTFVNARLLPGETALVEYVSNTGFSNVSLSTPAHPNFDRSKMPLSPYKALGLCGTCTVFWMGLLSLVPACFLGFFPVYMFWFLPIAYGLAGFASTLYEV